MPTPRPLATATTKTTRAGTPNTPKRPATKARRSPQSRSRGQVVEKEPGRWLVRVTTGRDRLTGKRQTTAQTITGTRMDAERARTALLAKVDAGEYRAPSKLTLAAFLRDTWLAERRGDVKTGKLSARAYECYARQVEKLAEHFGAVELDAIDKCTVAEVRRLLVERFKPSAAQRAFDVFRMALRYAWRLDMIAQNPALAVARVTTPAPRTGVLTPEQVGAFLTAAEGYRYGTYAALFHVSLLAGLRPGEVAALTWADLQLKEELGLDHFEGRTWAGLHHHHALLSLISFAFLQPLRRAEHLASGGRGENRGALRRPAARTLAPRGPARAARAAACRAPALPRVPGVSHLPAARAAVDVAE